LSGKIAVLPEDLTRKIAAGEVVERPASVVKELLENALDAGATEITIELKKGGCESIRIIDNGEGIDPQDVPLAFERYATSKIYRFDDIYRVASYGFRGEALPSIASISRVEMTTKKKSVLAGTKIIVEAGQVKTISEAGCPVGTSILVDRIFDPVPVRKKFLKSEPTEQGHCVDVITKMALVQPRVKIRVTVDGKEVLSFASTADGSERISLVLGMDFTKTMLPVNLEKGNIRCHGFISRPEQTWSSAKHMYFFVNKRYVKDYLLNHAVMTAYRRLIDAKRYPSVVLFVDIPEGDVDVNIHPAKMEVRFRNPRGIYDLMVETLISVMADSSSVEGVHAYKAYEESDKAVEYKKRVGEAMKRYTLSSGHGKLFFNQGEVHSTQHHLKETGHFTPVLQTEPNQHVSEQSELSRGDIVFSELEYLGQVAGTYLVFSSGSALILMDQHAAHERVLFEKLKSDSRREGEKTIGQHLLLPEVISLSPADFTFLMECMDVLEDMGMEAEPFGGTAIVVKSVPAVLMHVHPKDMIAELIDSFSDEDRKIKIQERKEKILTFLACRGAVKANHPLSLQEVTALCHDLDNTSFPSTCPHGRPIYISFEIKDMEKMFKRR